MAFLQMLLDDGSFNGAQILKPETVAAIRRNQIGDLDVNPLKSSATAWSNDADLFPGMRQKWGFAFDINTEPGPCGRSGGSFTWAGLLNCYYWVDPVKKLTTVRRRNRASRPGFSAVGWGNCVTLSRGCTGRPAACRVTVA
jgi:methyl acetate hydrolase